MKDLLIKYCTCILLFFNINTSKAQQYLDYQLRLEPVWSRVADVLGEAGSVESVEFSPDNKYLVSGTKYDNSVIMWRMSDGQELWRSYTKAEIERVGWSAGGKYVAACSEDFLVTVFNAKDGSIHKILPHKEGIDGLTWSNKGYLLATGEEVTETTDKQKHGWIRLFDMETEKEIKKLDFGNTVNRLVFTQDDQYLLAVGHGFIKIYKTTDGSLVQTLKPELSTIFTSGVFSPDGKYVFAVGQGGVSRGNCYLWEWQSGKLIKIFNQLGKKIESVAWHPNGKYIAYVGHDPYVYVYRFADILAYQNDAIPVAHKCWAGDHAEFIDFNSTGSFVATAHQNGLIKLWVFMGENPMLNAERHNWIIQQQKGAKD